MGNFVPLPTWLQVSATEDAGLDSSDEEVGPSQGASDGVSLWILGAQFLWVTGA